MVLGPETLSDEEKERLRKELSKVSRQEGVALIRAAYERGVTFCDTAEVYGRAPSTSPLNRSE